MCKVNVVACFSYIQELVEASFCKNARDINKSKVSKFYLFFCYTVEDSEREIDGKLFNIIERTTVHIWLA